MTKETQGGAANRQGRILENAIIPIFKGHGFEVVAYREWVKSPDKHGEELLLKNVPYTTIYGHKGNNEFLIQSKKHKLNVRLECKWQQSSGSVDEKYPYLYLNCIESLPESDVIIIYGGGGMKAGAISWLKNAASTKLFQQELGKEKNIQVLSLEEFMLWANNSLRNI